MKTAEIDNFCRLSGAGKHDNVNDNQCNSFFICDCFRRVIKTCLNENKKFNPESKSCELGYECTILNKNSLLDTSNSDTDSSRVTKFCKDKSDGLYIDSEDKLSRKFFKCGENPHIYQCKLGYNFNPDTKWCEKKYTNA